MIKHGVGVTAAQTYVVLKVDLDGGVHRVV
jgi:hypothetical protein